MNKEYLITTLETLKKDGKATLNLKEAAVLTGGGYGKGGEFDFTKSFASLRYSNPLRLGSMVETTPQSAVRWVAKIGDATNYNSSPNGPWGEQVQFDVGNADTRFWSLQMRGISTVVPIRRWIMEDVPNAYMSIVGDILYELSQQEAFSCAQNIDNPGTFTASTATGSSAVTAYGNGFQWTLNIPSTANMYVGQFVTIAGATPAALNGTYRVLALTTNSNVTVYYPSNPGNYTIGVVTVTPASTAGFGGSVGLRGLDSYGSANATFSAGTTISQNPQFVWGASGDAPSTTAGRHTIANITQGGSTIAANIVYNDLVNVANALPGQYWSMESTCWHIHPDVIRSLRTLKDSQNLPQFLDVGIPRESGAVASIQGWPVIPNPFLSYKYPIYLMNPMMALSFVDSDDLELRVFEQYLPGTMAIWVQKRLAFSIKDPAAIVRLQALA